MHLIQKIAFFCLRSFVKGFFVVSSFVSSLVKRVCPFVIVKFRTFFWKNPHLAKMTKNGQKWYENRVFGLFGKTMSLVMSGNDVKWKYLCSF